MLGENEHNYSYVGKVGLFLPVKSGCNGGELLREKDGKYYAVTGSKGYRWVEAELVMDKDWKNMVDDSYHIKLVDDAIDNISKYGDFEWFTSEDMVCPYNNSKDSPPWVMPCGNEDCDDCSDRYVDSGGVVHCKKGYSPLPF